MNDGGMQLEQMRHAGWVQGLQSEAQQLRAIEPSLTLADRVRLVTIAHETKHDEVRKWALDTLGRGSATQIGVAPQVAQFGWGGAGNVVP